MSNSGGSGKFAWETLERRGGERVPQRDEWPATRAEPASKEAIDEWQATRVQPRAGRRANGGAPRIRATRPPCRRRMAAPAALARTPRPRVARRLGLDPRADRARDPAPRPTRTTTSPPRRTRSAGRSAATSASCSSRARRPRRCSSSSTTCSPEFIAVHDIATASSRKLLAGIAAASGRAVQKLVIRRQGYGTALATLEFVELPTADNQLLRLYTTEVDADTRVAPCLARVLLAYSRLGVVMVGELPAHALAAALKPLHDDIIAGPWPNRELLLLPLASASTLVTQASISAAAPASRCARRRRSRARPTPGASSAAPGTGCASRRPTTAAPSPSSAPSSRRLPAAQAAARAGAARRATRCRWTTGSRRSPLPMRPMPAIAPPTARRRRRRRPAVERYVRQLSELNGIISCCVFELAERPARSPTPAPAPAPPRSRRTAATLLASMMAASRGARLRPCPPEAAVTLGAHHLLLRGVPRHPGLALHAVLDKTSANLTLARLQMQRLDVLFDEDAAA